MSSTDRPRVAFLGLGRMGAPMARHVARAGYDLAVWNRTRSKSESFAQEVAQEPAQQRVQVADTPAEAARGRQVVVLMLADPTAVREVMSGSSGVLQSAEPGTLVINSSTVGPTATREVAAEASRRGLRYVDAPVYGTVGPATEGVLEVYGSGEREDFERARTFLDQWGDPAKVRYLGPVGTGSAAKLVRNLILGVSIAATGEALRLSGVLGLPDGLRNDLIETSQLGPSYPRIREIMETGRTKPAAFEMVLLLKDLDLCLREADELGLTQAVREACRRVVAAGHGDEDARALAVRMAEGV